MRHETLRKSAIEAVSEVAKTEFKVRAGEFRAMIVLLDRLDSENDLVSSFAANEYEHIIRNANQLVENHKLRRAMGMEEDRPWPAQDVERVLKVRLLEKLAEREVAEYAKEHGCGKIFVPHMVLEAITNSRTLAESGAYDLGLSVEPEGCAYAYFFETQGMRILHVYADFDGKGGIDYREVDDLGELRGKRILIIEDDIQTGLTLRTVLERIKGIGADRYGLFLGNLAGFQNRNAIPKQVEQVHMNTIQASECGHNELESNAVKYLGPILFDKYGLFR
jgi:hypothetical protein